MIDELETVRRIGADDDRPDPEARERVRARVLVPPPRRRARRLLPVLLPAGAVALGAVLVVALGSTSEDEPDAPPATRTAAAATPPPSLFPEPDEYLYVRSRGSYLACSAADNEMTCKKDPERTREIWLSERRDGRLVEGPGRQQTPSQLGRTTLYLGNRRFTHDELAAYAPTGAELLRELQEGRQEGQGDGGASYPYVQITDALREAPMPPDVRRALIDALPLVPGVDSLGETRDALGRAGLAYARVAEGRREEVIVDPETLTMLEERTFLLDEKAAPGGGFRRGDKIGGSVYLERAVVDRAGKRP